MLARDNTSNHTLVLEYSGTGHTFKITLDGSTQQKTGVTYTQLSQTLLIGGYQTTSGTTGRYWKGTINSIAVYYAAE